MNSSKICPVDGSQDEVQQLVWLIILTEAGLAMETSKVESAARNQAEDKLNQLERSESAGTIRISCKR
ncbi:hypothetical protein F511_21280 [Dorcoceras hygrometricum]|uniref:Uncharacterized protein n=1 Tax=Dorcoceras hygrometricum TaxID=472368 RepID=A0A2Z7C193_9LAMI|nr:hypothetical protein F511_21280 [Dorcoceras hygrometricum]